MLSRVGTPLLRWSWHLIHFRGTICGSVPLGVQGTCQKMTSIRVIAVTFRRKVWEELFVSQLIWYLLGVEINWNSADRTKFWHPLGLLFFNKFRRSGPPSIIFFFISTATELYWMHFIISLGDGHLTGGHVVLNECYLANTRWIPSENLGGWAILQLFPVFPRTSLAPQLQFREESGHSYKSDKVLIGNFERNTL